MRSINEIVKDILESNNKLLTVLAKYETSEVVKKQFKFQIESNESAKKLLEL